MKKVFLGQAVSGMDVKALTREVERIAEALKKSKHIVYSTMEKEGNNDFKRKGDWVLHAFREIDKSDVFFGLLRSDHRSEGMLIEVGYSLAKKKEFYLAVHSSVKNTYLRDFADKVIEWEDFDDLIKKLERIR